jgi:predicted molibdopterin-dependent oxidoreductase YjgC
LCVKGRFGFDFVNHKNRLTTPLIKTGYVSKITEMKSEDIIKAARLYASVKNASIFYSMGITQHASGTENVVALTNLALATGNIGKSHAGINPLRGQNNVQGACDMGCLPNVLPGYQPLYGDSNTYWQRLTGGHPYSETKTTSDEIREKFSRAWGVELSDVPGRTISDMFNPNPNRWCNVMYIMGENPMLSDPNTNHVQECLESLDFLIVQDIFLTETGRFADVVLPAASFAEKDGTFINTERRVQRVRKVLNPRGKSKPDWKIIQDLAQRFGFKWNYECPEDIWNEMRELTPHYFGGMSYERLDTSAGLQWPCTTEDYLGTPIMHVGKFARGIGQFSAVEYRPLSNEQTCDEYPFILTIARKLNQFHTRTMTGKTKGLNRILGTGFIEINPSDAEKLLLNINDKVKIISRRGHIESKVLITDSVSQGVICGNFHFKDMPINKLTNPAICNMSVAPSLKVSAVRIEKING